MMASAFPFLLPEGRPFYGLDGPHDLIRLTCLTGLCLAATCLLSVQPSKQSTFKKAPKNKRWRQHRVYLELLRPLCIAGALFWGLWAVSYVYVSTQLKYSVADRMVSMAGDWGEAPAVLDVGCGRGLLMNTAALAMKRGGANGSVTGVDLWDSRDQSQNSAAAALANAEKEGVRNYVDVRTADARNLPFADASFDVVLSSLCIHNIGEKLGRNTPRARTEREKALGEILRVLKPGGRLVIWDAYVTDEYHEYFEKVFRSSFVANSARARLSEIIWVFVDRTKLVSVTKPLATACIS